MNAQTKPPRDPGEIVLADRIVELLAAADAEGRSGGNPAARERAVSTLTNVLTLDTLADVRAALERSTAMSGCRPGGLT